VQVESDPHKVKTVQALAQEAPPPPRQRRERPAPQTVADEPLVQIETQKRDTPADPASARPSSEHAATP
jgi:hypothetical protein